MTDRADEIRAELVPVAADLLDDFDMLADAARRQSNLTSPETTIEALYVEHSDDGRRMPPTLLIGDKLVTGQLHANGVRFEIPAEAVLRSVEEGNQ